MSPSADWLNGALLQHLCAQGSENAWTEFKDGNVDPAKLGDTLAALSNGAALDGQPFGYLVFGVRDGDLAIVGTSVRLDRERAGSEGLIEFLSRHLEPRPLLAWGATLVEGHHVEAIRIAAALRQPTAFDGRERVRVKSRNQSLRDYPEHATRLWAALAAQSVETRELTSPIALADVGEWLDLDGYRRLRGLEGQSLPVVATTLVQDRALVRHDDGRLSITMLGALLFARQLSRSTDLDRRAVRVIEYPGVSRAEIEMRESGSA